MLNSLLNLPLRFKIVALAGIPLLALCVLGVIDTAHYQSLSSRAERFDQLVELSVGASDLVHELQKERGASAGFLGSGGKRFGDVVAAQRTLTDQRLQAYRTLAASAPHTRFGPTELDELEKALAGIGRLRAEVDTLRIGTPEQVARYTALTEALLEISTALPRHAPEGEISSFATSLGHFRIAKEQSGIERALLTSAFARDTSTLTEIERFVELRSKQDAYLEAFEDAADESVVKRYEQLRAAPAMSEVARLRSAFLERALGEGGFGVDPQAWFDAATSRIDLLAEFENVLAEELGGLASELAASSAAALRLLVCLLLGALLLVASLAVLFGRSLLGSIHRAALLASAMARGDLTQTLPPVSHHDETGRLLEALEDTRTRLMTVLESAQRVSESVQSGTRELHEGHMRLRERTDEQGARLEDSSSSMEEIAATTKNNAASAEQADCLAGEARRRATTGKEVVSEAVGAMGEINEASRRIENIIGVIDEIAFQTNLLALNAAVEAARAGEQGRGFAVVASEVRQLAGRSSVAAKEIKELIQDSVAKVDSGASLVDRSGQTLDELTGSIAEVSELISEIAGASREQAVGVERIHAALTQIDSITQHNGTLVSASLEASTRMDEEARELAERLSFFRIRSAA